MYRWSAAGFYSIPLILLVVVFLPIDAQAQDVNYDESNVPEYSLPDPLLLSDGTKVTDANTWRRRRRPEILGLFEQHVYGKVPPRPEKMNFTVTSVDTEALDSKATRRQISVHFTPNKDGPLMDILIYIPNHLPRPVPAFLSLNFYGNHSIHTDPAINLSRQWMRDIKITAS